MSTKIIIGDIMLIADTDEKQKLILPYNIKPEDIQREVTKENGKYTLHLWHNDLELLSLSVKSNRIETRHK